MSSNGFRVKKRESANTMAENSNNEWKNSNSLKEELISGTNLKQHSQTFKMNQVEMTCNLHIESHRIWCSIWR